MDPFDEMKRFDKLMKNLIEGLMGGSRVEIVTPFRMGSARDGLGEVREPLVDTREDEKTVTVIAEVPGVEKKDIRLKVKKDDMGNHVLIVTARRNDKQVKKSEGSTAASINSLSYRKEVMLPSRVKKDSAKATYHNGILEVKFERAEPMNADKGTEIIIE